MYQSNTIYQGTQSTKANAVPGQTIYKNEEINVSGQTNLQNIVPEQTMF